MITDLCLHSQLDEVLEQAEAKPQKQVGECWPGMCEALGWIPGTAETKQEVIAIITGQ